MNGKCMTCEKEGRFCPPFRIYLKEKNSQAQRKRKATMTTMQMKLELVAVPVSDVDRAKAFYTEKIGFHADFDQQVREDLRFVQLTPPGSACSESPKCGSTRSSMSSTFSGSIQTAYSGDASREVFLIASLT
jgi:Glyoxalase/Bleomycin resistance protein/Dioxygenase superfamily